jgi:hypothetical protein
MLPRFASVTADDTVPCNDHILLSYSDGIAQASDLFPFYPVVCFQAPQAPKIHIFDYVAMIPKAGFGFNTYVSGEEHDIISS